MTKRDRQSGSSGPANRLWFPSQQALSENEPEYDDFGRVIAKPWEPPADTPPADAAYLRFHVASNAPIGADDNPAYLRSLPYAEYLQTRAWTATRKLALHAARYRCEDCRVERLPQEDGPSLQVHHLHYETLGMEAPGRDIVVLCGSCHRRRHGIEL